MTCAMIKTFRPLLCCAALFTLPAPPATADDATAAIARWCDDLGARLRSVNASECRKQPFVAAEESTAGGRLLVWRDFAARRTPAAKAPRVLVIGGIHGDELTAVSIVFRWLEWVGEDSGKKYHWRMIPSANPDGLLTRPSTRANSRGVDLNRNFPTPDWASDAHKYWIERTKRDPRRYPGESGGSEIETRWLEKQIAQYQPDVIISVHAPYNLLDYDGPAPQPLRFGRLMLNRLGVYPGSLGNYGGLHKNVPVVTIELPHATMMPPPREQRTMWRDMLHWMNRNISAGNALNSKTSKRPEKYGEPVFKAPALKNPIDHQKID